MSCKICGSPNTIALNRCADHLRCDICRNDHGVVVLSDGALCAEHRAEQLETMLSNIEATKLPPTTYTSAPICPHCGQVFGDWTAYEFDDETEKVNCENCGNHFMITMFVSYIFTTSPAK